MIESPDDVLVVGGQEIPVRDVKFVQATEPAEPPVAAPLLSLVDGHVTFDMSYDAPSPAAMIASTAMLTLTTKYSESCTPRRSLRYNTHGYVPHPNAKRRQRSKFKPSRVSHLGR